LQSRSRVKVVTRTLGGILRHAEANSAVRRSDLRPGDQVLVATENSLYSIVAEDDSSFVVRGGWFDREGGGRVRVAINGCTWGGSIIQTRIVAARGLCLEFANRVVTSPIREFWLIRNRPARLDGTGRTRRDAEVLAASGISWD